MGQIKPGWIVASIAVAFVLVSVGYNMGKKAGQNAAAAASGIAPAGAPLSMIQIEPIQPQEELAAINNATPALTAVSGETSFMPLSTSPAAGAAQLAGTGDDPGRVRQIQTALKQAGFDPGSVDGRMGAKTKVAIRSFQQSNGLEPDGKVGSRTWSKLEPFWSQASSSAAGSTNTTN